MAWPAGTAAVSTSEALYASIDSTETSESGIAGAEGIENGGTLACDEETGEGLNCLMWEMYNSETKFCLLGVIENALLEIC